MKYLFIITLLFVGCFPQEKQTPSQIELQQIQLPIAENASLPHLTNGADGKLYFSWVEKQDSGLVLFKYATLKNEQWTASSTIASGNDWFVNWADYPMLTVNSNGDMLANYLAKSSAGTYSYNVNLIAKEANEPAWSEPFIPHTDGTPTEHGFVTMLPIDAGFQVAWLDGRNTAGGSHGHGKGAMTLRTAVVTTKGEVSDEVELDARVCDCCQTGGVVTAKGPLFVFRDRSDLEIRDISSVRLVDQSWTESQPVFQDNWNIEGCPVNGPRVGVSDNNVAVAWYTEANARRKVKLAFSSDFGASFNEPIIIDGTNPLGRVDVAFINQENVLVSWLTTNDSTTSIQARTASILGVLGDPLVIASTSESRASGFPQLVIHKGFAYCAWTVPGADISTIQVVKFDLNGLSK